MKFPSLTRVAFWATLILVGCTALECKDEDPLATLRVQIAGEGTVDFGEVILGTSDFVRQSTIAGPGEDVVFTNTSGVGERPAIQAVPSPGWSLRDWQITVGNDGGTTTTSTDAVQEIVPGIQMDVVATFVMDGTVVEGSDGGLPTEGEGGPSDAAAPGDPDGGADAGTIETACDGLSASDPEGDSDCGDPCVASVRDSTDLVSTAIRSVPDGWEIDLTVTGSILTELPEGATSASVGGFFDAANGHPSGADIELRYLINEGGLLPAKLIYWDGDSFEHDVIDFAISGQSTITFRIDRSELSPTSPLLSSADSLESFTGIASVIPGYVDTVVVSCAF